MTNTFVCTHINATVDHGVWHCRCGYWWKDGDTPRSNPFASSAESFPSSVTLSVFRYFDPKRYDCSPPYIVVDIPNSNGAQMWDGVKWIDMSSSIFSHQSFDPPPPPPLSVTDQNSTESLYKNDCSEISRIPPHLISFNDDNTAWLFRPGDNASKRAWSYEDRPCDDCGGNPLEILNDDECPARCINGRHTFELAVQQYRDVEIDQWLFNQSHNPSIVGPGEMGYLPDGTHKRKGRYLASVVPGMVFQILDHNDHYPEATHLSIENTQCYLWQWDETCSDFICHQDVVLPSSAKPGMYAIKLNVVSKFND